MIGTILNQIRQARALELRELTADALAEAQLQTQASHPDDRARAHPLGRRHRHRADPDPGRSSAKYGEPRSRENRRAANSRAPARALTFRAGR